MVSRVAAFLVLSAGIGLSDTSVEGFVAQVVMVGGKERHFRLLVPRSEPGAKPDPAPVVLFLHGAGERGTDNEAQLKHFPEKMAQADWRARYRCFLIAPQCEPDQQWVEAPWSDKASKPMATEPSEMMQVAIAALEKVRTEHTAAIDPARVYLTGLSMGGFATWELAMRHPDWFAAAAPVCGGGDESRASRLKTLPVWAFHGKEDTVVWPERSERLVAAVNHAGGQAKLSLLPGVGHDAWTPAYDPKSGLLDWLFRQSRPATRP